MAKMHAKTIVKAHKIGRAIAKAGGARNPYAVGTAVAKRAAASRRRSR